MWVHTLYWYWCWLCCFPASPPAFQGCTAADDKTAAVEDFLRYLYGAMARDAIWQYASEDQLQDAQMAIERSVMNRIFKLAFYPNQDGDILRDQWVAGVTTVSLKVFQSVLLCKCYMFHCYVMEI